MFGFFKKKQPLNDASLQIASSITNMLNVQLTLCRSSDKILDNWAIGYICGFADGVLQYKGIGTDETGTAVMLMVLGNIFGDEKRVEYFERYVFLKESENLAALEGERIAGNEAYSLLNGSSKRAIGLTAYCHGVDQGFRFRKS